MIKRLRSLWSSHFVANPLLRRETGLWEGRSWWRSPLLIVLLLAIVVPSVEIVATIVNWSSLAEVKIPTDPTRITDTHNLAAASRSMLMGHISKWTGWILVPVLFIFPLLLTARCWARESEQAQRHQLGASLITTRQLIGAKALIWLSPVLVMLGLVLAHEILSDVAAVFWAPRDSFIWMNRAGTIGNPSGELVGVSTSEGIARMSARGFLMALGLSALSVAYVFGIAVATRLSLAGLWSTLCAALTAAIAYCVVMLPFLGLRWLFGNVLNWFSEEVLLFALVLMIQVFAASLCWRGLPTRVARAYGMNS